MINKPNLLFYVSCFLLSTAIEMVLENNENHLADEIGKVKDRLKTITSSLENQQTFLRLIIQVFCNGGYVYETDFLYRDNNVFQKMEIKTEEDEVDEGVSSKEMAFTNNLNGKWSSPRVRTKLKSSFSFSKCYTK